MHIQKTIPLYLLLFVGLLFCLPLNSIAETKQVVFIRYRIAPNYFASVVEGFKSTMTEQGFHEDKHIEYIDILTRSASQDSVPDVVEAVKKYKDSADMFITCGWVSMTTRKLLKDTGVPQLFVPVLRSVALVMLPSMTQTPSTNLSGLYLMYPPEKILRLAKLILPAIRNYAYVYDSRIPADLIFKKAYEELNAKNRYGIKLHYLDLAGGIDEVLTSFKDHQIDAYGGIVGSFKNRESLTSSALPVITSFTLDIDSDSIAEYTHNDTTVAGLFNPFRYCGVQAALMTADIFNNKNTIENTRPRPSRQAAFINLRNARRMNIPISFDALEAVDIVVK